MTAAIGLAVVGAGYWGPNLVRNAMATPSIRLRWLCDLDEDRARRVLGPYRRCRSTDSFDAILDDARHRRGRDRDAGGHPRAARAGGVRGRQARRRREAAGSDARPRRRRWSQAAEDRRAGPDERPHLLLHPGGAVHPRARSPAASSATSFTSTRSGSTSAWCSPTSTCSGTSPRTTCRSSTTSSRRAVAGRGLRARRRPAGRRARPASAT